MIEIRQTTTEEFRETENVIREAFWNHYGPACTEHYLIHKMRDCNSYIPKLDIVATDSGRIVGSSLCLKSIIEGDDRKQHTVLSLGPIGVLPEYQKKGIGGKLLEYSKQIARELGYAAILLCGDPDYYSRQGFVAAEKFGIRTAENRWFTALHACELYPDSLKDARGRYFEDAVYDIDELAAKVYDEQFPSKEIVVGTPMQRRFERMITTGFRPYDGLEQDDEIK